MHPDEDDVTLRPPAPWVGDDTERRRIERITAEIETGFSALDGLGPAVSFFGSARTDPEDPAYDATRETARLIGAAGAAVITGGGPGLMEAANLGARQAGATSVGLTIDLPLEEEANDFLDIAVHFRYFFARRLMFVRYASAFVVHPGGFGTLDEMFEALTLIQNRKIERFPVVLFDSSHWGGLLDWLAGDLVAPGLIDPRDLDDLHVVDDPADAAAAVAEALGPLTP